MNGMPLHGLLVLFVATLGIVTLHLTLPGDAMMPEAWGIFVIGLVAGIVQIRDTIIWKRERLRNGRS